MSNLTALLRSPGLRESGQQMSPANQLRECGQPMGQATLPSSPSQVRAPHDR